MAGPIERIEAALRERYNVASLEGVGPFAAALDAARDGDIEPLRAAVTARDMYRWGPGIVAALAELSSPGPVASADDDASTDLAALTVPQLREIAAARGITIPAGSTKAAIVSLLTPFGEGAGDEAPDSGEQIEDSQQPA